LFCVCTWCLALASRGFTRGWDLRTAAGVGALIGIAALVKTTGIALIPALLIGLLLAKNRPSLPQVALAASVALVLAVPWWVRNQNLYGDPLAIGAFTQAFRGSPQASGFIQALGPLGYWIDWVGWWTLRSFIGAFGYMDIFLPDNLYRIGFAGLVVLWILGVLEARNPEWNAGKGVGVMNAVFAFVVLAMSLRVRSAPYRSATTSRSSSLSWASARIRPRATPPQPARAAAFCKRAALTWRAKRMRRSVRAPALIPNPLGSGESC